MKRLLLCLFTLVLCVVGYYLFKIGFSTDGHFLSALLKAIGGTLFGIAGRITEKYELL